MTTYDPRTALIVVDIQNDFADSGGSLYVPGGEDVIDPVNREIARASSEGALVVHTQDWHPESTPHFEKDGGIWPVHCVAGRWGADFHPGLTLGGPTIRKGVGREDGYSGFSTRDSETGESSSTGLAEMLEERSIERVVVVGLALDYCVKATALDARARGLATQLLRSATRSVDLESGDGDRAIEEMRAAGIEILD